MSIVEAFKCDECGEPIRTQGHTLGYTRGVERYSMHQLKHACSAKCAGAMLRKIAAEVDPSADETVRRGAYR